MNNLKRLALFGRSAGLPRYPPLSS